MAVWLSMSLSYGGAGDQSNTSRVDVSVTVHWDTVSYNGLNPPLSVTADGLTDTVNVSFNTGQSSSGSQTIYSKYWNIGHDANGSARTVTFSASYATGTASGTVSTSSSLPLAAISGSGSGGDSGGDSGDSGDSGGSSGGSGSSDESSSNIEVHPDTNCTYLGTSHGYYTYGNNPIDGESCSIKFKTPSDLITSKSVSVVFGWFDFYFDDGESDGAVYFSIRKEDIYGEEVGWGSLTFTDNGAGWSSWGSVPVEMYSTTQYAKSLEPNAEYVISMYVPYGGTFKAKTPPAIILDYTARGGIHVKSNSTEKKYLIYAKTGDTVDMYEPYLRNGDSWEPIGNMPITGDQYT